METLQMSQTRAYGVGGTIHVIVNNQIGFTTSNSADSRSTRYATDISKFIETPIFHVNADDPEAVIQVSKLAADYRDNFKKDVVIDLVCYRRSGHNEADDPSSTQPVMYKAIKRHPTVLQLYEEKLINSGIISNEDVRTFKKTYRSAIEKGKSVTFNLAPRSNEDQWFDWNPYLDKKWYEHVETKLSHKTILSLTKQITSVPQNFQLQKKVKKIFSDRQQMAKGDLPINWGVG